MKPTGARRPRRPCPTCSWSPTGSNTPRGIPTSTRELETLTAVVGASLPPYGVDRPTWSRIHDLATAVGEASDDETAAATIAALRGFLRPLV